MRIIKERKQPTEGRSHPLDMHHGCWQTRGVGRRGEHSPRRLGERPEAWGETGEVGQLPGQRTDLAARGRGFAEQRE
eukprot:6071623-Alexandrium_andersonii.AAC.1